MGTFRYKAFISYNHQDRDWSAWLQRSLENYRVPRRLVGSQGEFGPVPRRLTPVFRDREDLSSASDLSLKVKGSLEASEALIVICSPAAAKSTWVSEEINYFRSLGRGDRIFALIVGGDPQPSDPSEQCFPIALLRNEDGTATEPLAADTRKWADGKLLAKLKIVSGILGVRLDELRQRNMQRRRRNWAIAGTSAFLLLVLTGTLLVTALTSQKEARLQRSNTEELLSYMLGNLKRLDPIVGLEVLGQEDEQVKQYLRTLGFSSLSSEQLVQQGMEWREQGQAEHDRGRIADAMEHFQRSRAAFIEFHQREGGTTQALFELGQAEFWIGYVYFDEGDLDQAQESFLRYGAITRRLVNADPNDATMIMELAYTLTNLGALERERMNPDADKALRLMQSSVQYKQIALVLDPENDDYRQNLSSSLAYLSDAWMDSCDLGKAIDFRQQSVELARVLYEKRPADKDLSLELAYALSGLASIQKHIPIPEQALQNLQESRDLLMQASAQENGNPQLRWYALRRDIRMLNIRTWSESAAEVWPEMVMKKKEIEALQASYGLDDFGKSVEYAVFLFDFSKLAQMLDKSTEAGTNLALSMEQLSALVAEKPENRQSQQALAEVWLENWFRHGELPGEQAAVMLSSYLVDPGKVTSCTDAGLAAKLEIMRGNSSLASDYTLYLLEKGYFEPEFVAFCRNYDLCD